MIQNRKILENYDKRVWIMWKTTQKMWITMVKFEFV